jgi:hypothetical protein
MDRKLGRINGIKENVSIHGPKMGRIFKNERWEKAGESGH